MQVSETKTDTYSLFKFALPFIIANFSFYIFQIVDIIMINWYDPNAAAEISTMFRSIVFILLTPTILLSITSMFSGKYNGAMKYELTTKPIWQGTVSYTHLTLPTMDSV